MEQVLAVQALAHRRLGFLDPVLAEGVQLAEGGQQGAEESKALGGAGQTGHAGGLLISKR
ncbi:hypothetical protein [Streptomyces sp. NPDC018947]|uniref:hypothetical protein n=1 Tax=Streptomyces sp. NPDC018947 TaxID=3365054 RepID=UPI0037A84DF9